MASAGDDGGSTVLVSADAVGVYYVAGSLYVIVQGVAYGGTTDIHIEKEEFVGGLRFAIKGKLDHVAGFQPYCREYVEKIEIPSKVFPSKSIVFEDAEHLLGIVIPIKFFGLG
jgi:hypothetical protein